MHGSRASGSGSWGAGGVRASQPPGRMDGGLGARGQGTWWSELGAGWGSTHSPEWIHRASNALSR